MVYGPFSFFNSVFTIFPVIFSIVAVFIIGTIIFTIVKRINTWSYNNAQPVLTVQAKTVSKRTDVSSYASNNDETGIHDHTSTSYFVTFEVESGDRMELQTRGDQYGMLAENDMGKLTFQGSRFLGFERL